MYSSARLVIFDLTPSRSVMSISSACLSTSMLWIAVFAVATVAGSPFDFCGDSEAMVRTSAASSSSRVPAITLKVASPSVTSPPSGCRRASSLSLSAMRGLQPVERLLRSLANPPVAIDLEVLQIVLGGMRPKRTQRLGRRHPCLPIPILERRLDDRSGRTGADPSEGAAADHPFAPAAVLQKGDQRADRGAAPSQSGRHRQGRPNRRTLRLTYGDLQEQVRSGSRKLGDQTPVQASPLDGQDQGSRAVAATGLAKRSGGCIGYAAVPRCEKLGHPRHGFVHAKGTDDPSAPDALLRVLGGEPFNHCVGRSRVPERDHEPLHREAVGAEPPGDLLDDVTDIDPGLVEVDGERRAPVGN